MLVCEMTDLLHFANTLLELTLRTLKIVHAATLIVLVGHNLVELQLQLTTKAITLRHLLAQLVEAVH